MHPCCIGMLFSRKNEGMELRCTVQGLDAREGFAMVGCFRVL